MKVLILMGSPRVHGNTAELCKPFREELERGGAEVVYMPLADKHILPCKACYASECIPYEIQIIWHLFRQRKQWQGQGSLRKKF